jgi:hypothetical protein
VIARDVADGVETVEINYTLADIGAVAMQKWQRWAIIVGLFTAMLCAIPIVIMFIDGGTLRDGIRFIDMPFTAGVFGLLVLWIMVMTVLKFYWQRHKGLLGPMRLTPLDEGLAIENKRGQAILYWASMSGVKATESRLFFLLRQGGGAFVVPARAFASREAFERWTSIAKRNFENRA